jgi:hypothetical protein
LESLVEKHLTPNQMFGEQTPSRSEPATDEPFVYIK